MKATAIALCGFRCSGQSSTMFFARARSLAAVMSRIPVSTRRDRRLRQWAWARRKTNASSAAPCGWKESRKPRRTSSYSCSCSSGRTTSVVEVRPCFEVFRRLRCLPASILGRLASRCRSGAIAFRSKWKRSGPVGGTRSWLNVRMREAGWMGAVTGKWLGEDEIEICVWCDFIYCECFDDCDCLIS